MNNELTKRESERERETNHKMYRIIESEVCVGGEGAANNSYHIKVSNLNYVKRVSLREFSPAEHKILCTVKSYYRANRALQWEKTATTTAAATLKNWPTTINNYYYMNVSLCLISGICEMFFTVSKSMSNKIAFLDRIGAYLSITLVPLSI